MPNIYCEWMDSKNFQRTSRLLTISRADEAFHVVRNRCVSDTTSLQVLAQDAASLRCLLTLCWRIISPKSICVFDKGFSRRKYPIVCWIGCGLEATGNIGWGEAKTTVFNVGLDRKLGLGLTGINSLVPCSGFPPIEESVPNSAFPCSVSAIKSIPLELSIVCTDELNESSVRIPWVAGRFFHYVVATTAFAVTENQYTVYRYSTCVELVHFTRTIPTDFLIKGNYEKVVDILPAYIYLIYG